MKTLTVTELFEITGGEIAPNYPNTDLIEAAKAVVSAQEAAAMRTVWDRLASQYQQ